MRHGWLWDTQEERPWTQRAGGCQPAQPSQPGRLHHDLPNANLTFLTSDFYCFWQKQPWTTQWGRAGLEANSLSCGEGTWTRNLSNWQPPGTQSSPGLHSEQEQPPSPGREPSTCLPAITDIISKQGSFSELLFLIFCSLNANPFDKTVPYAFSVLFPLNLFLPVEKRKKKKKEGKWKKKKKKENTSQPSLAAPGFALIPPLSFMLPTGISIWL